MKNKIYALTAVLAFCLTCQVADAATTFNNNLYLGLTNNSDVSTLQTLLISQGLLNSSATGNFFNLTKQAVIAFQNQNGISPTGYVGPITRAALNELETSGTTPSAPISTTQATVQSSIPIAVNFSTYPQGSIADYNKNPAQFLNSPISIKSAFISDFLPAGDRGGSNSYVEITNESLSQEKLMLEAYNSTDYAKIASVLNKADAVTIYGIGAPSASFTSSNSFTSYNTSEPVILVQRIDKCADLYDCGAGQSSTVFDRTNSATVSAAVPTAQVAQQVTTVSAISTPGAYNSSDTPTLIRSKLSGSYNALGSNTDLVNGLNGAYSQATTNYFNQQLAANPNNAQVETNYISTIAGNYQSLLTTVGILQTSASNINNTLSGYQSSADLSQAEQQAVSNLNTYALSKISDYNTRTVAITAAWTKFKNLSASAAAVDTQTLNAASADLSAEQQYFIGERNALLQQITTALGSF